MRFVIVTGMSGSGKTTVLRMLEDEGYFCVDNLPILLLSKFAEIAMDDETGVDCVAVCIDIRSGEHFKGLEQELFKIKAMGVNYEILFLESSDRTLIKRFKETRRDHPLSRGGRIENGIQLERKAMGFLKEDANYIIDTSNLLTRELRPMILKIFVDQEDVHPFNVMIMSFGFKHGIPSDADLVFDVRFLPNPFYVLELRTQTGNDKPVQDYVLACPQAHEFLDQLEGMIKFLIPYYMEEGKMGLVIGIGCTGGHHRSVTIANKLYERLKSSEEKSFGVNIVHRDIEH